ncbi:hypothetical protein SAMN05443575_1738 [Jatrophihabitans endophyticus]|uniref:Methyltransferase domain-containing protein n=1 Tax=Jatrophihabitans endophyticus TaxID=1206085 RepID=A0A1M5I376_9ACTN|nr:class I SAM-dependent methyltransferase [Jatrophihabitans endophyticus]SHG22755.1 hypothetical protein SAMN05443575_1738 [Jatrophihabitans endophyticus]
MTPADAAAGSPRRVPGAVEQFKQDRIVGWVAVADDAPASRVTLEVNGQRVAATWSSEPDDSRRNWGVVRPFRFWLRDLWDFLSPDDAITVCFDGRPLPIARRGMLARPETAGERSVTELFELLAADHIFGQTGRLQLSKTVDTAWQRDVLALFGEVRALLADRYDYDPFFVYGTLLGAVREQGFIGHDLDFDSAYVSRHTDGAAAAAELRDIAFALVAAGYAVESFLTHLHIVDAAGTRIDLFHLYFDDEGRLSFPFGIAGPGRITRDEWQGVHEIEFLGHRGVVPRQAERLVEHMYGRDWRDPKPGFMWYLDRTDRAPAGIMPPDMVEEIRWQDHYSRSAMQEPSPFARRLTALADLPATVVDLGAGDGRDAVAFADAGVRSVTAMERAPAALDLLRGSAAGRAGRVDAVEVDLADAAALREAIAQALTRRPDGTGPVLYLLRFVLHAVDEETERTLLDVLAGVTVPGDLLAVEFRTRADEDLPKARTGPRRRFLDGDAFLAEVGARMATDVVERSEGTGLSPVPGEDPQLCRLVLRRV